MKSILITTILLFTVILSQAQERWCGSDLNKYSQEQQEAALRFYQELSPIYEESRAIDSVALTVHIVQSISTGGNNITQQEIEEQIDILNSTFGSGIEFFLCGSPRLISGDAVYDFNSGDALNRSQRVDSTINIFIVEDLQISADQGLCGYAIFPFWGNPEDRYVMMNLACWNDGSTLAHELGHFYGLFHTHETFRGFELVNGSNCEIAGDLICDTPADPNVSRPNSMNGCNYTGNYVDPNGDFYAPPVSNIMSYAPSFCQRDLTEQQKAVIRSVNENDNSYLISNCDFYPDFGVSTELTTLQMRSDEDIKITYDFEIEGITENYDVDFKVILKDPDGSGLLLYEEIISIQEGQRSIMRTLDLDFPITKGSDTYILEATMDSQLKFIERTETNNQAITTIEVDNSSLDDVLVFPNPTIDQLKLFFRDSKASGAFTMRVFAYDGRFILEQEGFKNREEFFQIIDVSNVNKGLYILKVDFERVNKEYVFKFLKL